MKYACIELHRFEFEVRLMCRVLSVSPSGFYAASRREKSCRRLLDERLADEIRLLHRGKRKSYGSPRVQRDLRDLGFKVGEKRVARVMREEGIRAKQAK